MNVESSRRLQDIEALAADLVREIQLSFWVDFTSDELTAAETIGDLFDCIERKLDESRPAKCLSSLAFYRLRRVLVELSGRNRQDITPATALEELIPPKVRRAWWESLQEETRFFLRPLQPSRELCWAFWSAAVLAACVAAIECLPLPFGGLLAIAAGLFGVVTVYSLLFSVTVRFHRTFPEDIRIVRQLVEMVRRDNYGKLSQEAGGSTKEQAWTAFRELVGAVTGIDPWAVSREMRFPEDVEIE